LKVNGLKDMKKKCNMKCQFFLRCLDADEGTNCIYDINEDNGDEFLERTTY
jgi:hypothetical protein